MLRSLAHLVCWCSDLSRLQLVRALYGREVHVLVRQLSKTVGIFSEEDDVQNLWPNFYHIEFE